MPVYSIITATSHNVLAGFDPPTLFPEFNRPHSYLMFAARNLYNTLSPTPVEEISLFMP